MAAARARALDVLMSSAAAAPITDGVPLGSCVLSRTSSVAGETLGAALPLAAALAFADARARALALLPKRHR